MGSKVTVKPARTSSTPSEQAVAKAVQEFTITDARGRVITLREPGVLAQFRLIEAMGPEAARNEVYRGMVLPIIYVSAIDGLPAPSPSNKAQIEALIQRLDQDGMLAVADAIVEHFGDSNLDEQAAQVKN